MPPSRFLAQASKWRNAVAMPGKPNERYEELGSGYVSGSNCAFVDEVKGQGTLVKAGPWPLAPPATDESENPTKAASQDRFGYKPSLLVRGAAAGSLLLVDLTQPGKKKKQVLSINALQDTAALSDFDIAPWWSLQSASVLVAAASNTSDQVQITRMLQPFSQDGIRADASLLRAPKGGAIGVSSLQWHPTVPGLLLGSQGSTVNIWQTAEDRSSQTFSLKTDSQGSALRHAAWSSVGIGSQVGGMTADGYLVLWDARSGNAVVTKTLAHASKVKPSRLCFVRDSGLLLTSGFSQMRQREIGVWDPRSLTTPLKRSILTDSTSPSVLTPVADDIRNIVYLIGRGDTAVKWIELDAQNAFNEGSHALGAGVEAAGPAALAPQTLCNVMQAEIDRLYVPVAKSDGIIPVKIHVPRWQLIDYHENLFPDSLNFVTSGVEEERQKAYAWAERKDEDILPSLISRDPLKVDIQIKQMQNTFRPSTLTSAAVPSSPNAPDYIIDRTCERGPAPHSEAGSISNTNTDTQSVVLESTNGPPPSSHEKPLVPALAANQANATEIQPLRTVSAHAEAATLTSSTSSSNASELAASAPTVASSTVSHASSAPAAPAPPDQRPHWSRRFLAGSTPLIPAHQNLSAFDTTISPDKRAFDVNCLYLFYPVSSPGGRIGFHPLAAQGRMPLSPPSIRCNSKFIDFALDPFNPLCLLTASDDGKVRIWQLPAPESVTDALAAKDQPAACAALDVTVPMTTLELPSQCSSARIAEIKASPVANDVIGAILAGTGNESRFVIWNARTEQVELSSQTGAKGSFGFSWSPAGNYVAVAGKDKQLRVFDPRMPSQGGEIAAHDGPRSFKTIWIDDKHLITTGHGLESLRQIKLYDVEPTDGAVSVKLVKTLPLDNSPTVLFPHFDPDTNILWLWSRGDRSVSAYEVYPHPPSASIDMLSTLPTWQAGSPQVALAFLPKRHVNVKQVEVAVAYRVSQREIQRVGWNFSRARDDIFVPTQDVEEPLCSADDWISGRVQVPTRRYLSLQPKNMTPLSLAPTKHIASTLPKGPIAKDLSEEERKEQLLNNIFNKAKVDPSEDAADGRADRPQLHTAAKLAPDNDDWSD
ncbi:DUF1900-domain-containing protein [Tilletiaria anomala UBC 951]|uniref:Coronin n=1 Tax=Tilletiaria anomala (strain ATCC 24038 / CBS 436.72 / UBC 951) TaxID=1037660 RepID=A0A066VJG7_TILAU|nr:DUF1900-domain-containing protein [Tilletiaria anomala UBC 951]KDN38864.1 DUF1900-domain-containing protein [Tilletiaria anomala UBC 951]